VSEQNHIVQPKTYYVVFVALIVLLLLTLLAAAIPDPRFNVVAALSIASTKAALIILYFMHIRFSPSLTRIAACAGFVWLLILLVLLLGDYTTRGWDEPKSTRGPAVSVTAITMPA